VRIVRDRTGCPATPAASRLKKPFGVERGDLRRRRAGCRQRRSRCSSALRCRPAALAPSTPNARRSCTRSTARGACRAAACAPAVTITPAARLDPHRHPRVAGRHVDAFDVRRQIALPAGTGEGDRLLPDPAAIAARSARWSTRPRWSTCRARARRRSGRASRAASGTTGSAAEVEPAARIERVEAWRGRIGPSPPAATPARGASALRGAWPGSVPTAVSRAASITTSG
jgi:hypothetical protein